MKITADELEAALKLVDDGMIGLQTFHPDGYPGLKPDFLYRLVTEHMESVSPPAPSESEG